MKRFVFVLIASFLFATSIGAGHPSHAKHVSNKCPYGHCAYLMEGGVRCDKCAATNNPYCSGHSKPVAHKKTVTKK